MAEKWILIVDDEEAILAVLKNSLRKMGSDYHLVTASDGYQALEQLKLHSFDLVVTDYKMAGMNGLELLEAIHALQPSTRVILMTAYGSDALQAEARRKLAYSYLTKPFQIDDFRQVVKDALDDLAVSRPGILILSDERYRQVNSLLSQLRSDIAARCVFLTDSEGHFIARVGNVDDLPLEQIASLVGGSVASLLEAGRMIDGEADAINLAYREGKRKNLYVVNIGSQLLLIIVIDCNPYSTRLGSVWYYAQQVAVTLREKLGEAEFASPRQVFGDNLQGALESELDSLFEDSFSDSVDRLSETSEPRVPDSRLLSFQDAVESGLVEEKFARGSWTGNKKI